MPHSYWLHLGAAADRRIPECAGSATLTRGLKITKQFIFFRLWFCLGALYYSAVGNHCALFRGKSIFSGSRSANVLYISVSPQFWHSARPTGSELVERQSRHFLVSCSTVSYFCSHYHHQVIFFRQLLLSFPIGTCIGDNGHEEGRRKSMKNEREE